MFTGLGRRLRGRRPRRRRHGAHAHPCRLRTWLLRLIGAWLVITILPVLVFRFAPIPTSAYMLGQRVDWLFDSHDHPPLRQHWVPLDQISPQLQLAVVASEDQTFPTNWGFDLSAIEDAWHYNHTHRRTRGASTITQQTARNLFLWPSRTWMRKGLEVYFTVLLEVFWPKARILAAYLNIAQFGDGVYGAGAAAQHWFHCSAAALDAQQAAQLAAVLPNPVTLHAGAPSAYVFDRAAEIRQQMKQLGAGYLDVLR